MANLSLEVKKILKELEDHMQSKEDLDFVKTQIFNLYNAFFEEINNMEELANSRMAELAQAQVNMEEKFINIEKSLKNIEKDIYLDDEENMDDDDDYEFAIVCPYCNKEFVIDVDAIQGEVICPECKNEIELDWGDNSCSHEGCEGCSHDCHEEDDDM